MTRPKLIASALALGIVLFSDSAAADPVELPGHTRMKTTAGELTLPDGRSFVVKVGSHILDEPTWTKVDNELRRLQEREVRLDAENQSLRESAKSWTPGWKSLLSTFVVGVSVGTYVGLKF